MVAPATPSAIPTDAPTTIRGRRIWSITSCSVRPNSGTSKLSAERMIQAHVAGGNVDRTQTERDQTHGQH